MKAPFGNQLSLDEQFEGSLQNSELSEIDSEVAHINSKANKNKHNQKEKTEDDEDEIDEDIQEDYEEAIDEEIDEEPQTPKRVPKPKKSNSPTNVHCKKLFTEYSE